MITEGAILDIIRLLTGTIILLYASYTDIKTRRAANFLWVIIAIIGIILLLVQYVVIGFENYWYLLFIPLMMLLMYVFFQLRLLTGGADAKALMALAILLPINPNLGTFPLWQSFYPGSLVIFLNSLLIFLIIPLSLFIYNIRKKTVQFPHAFLGYTINIDKARQKFVWPLEKIKDGKRKISKMPKDFDEEKEFQEFEKLGITEIWVTPKIPFMIPLLLGFIATFILGDILTFCINNIVSFIISLL